MRLPAATPVAVLPGAPVQTEAPTKIEPVGTPEPVAATTESARLRISSNPPPPVHLQNEARSLEAGSPLLETNQKRGRFRVAGLVLGLALVSFGAAFAIQKSPELRVRLGIESAVVAVPPPIELPPPLPSGIATTEPAAVEQPEPPVVALEEPDVDAGAAATVVTDAGARSTTAQRPKLPAKPKLPVKKPAKKKRRR